jgi:hypothetical protein
MFLITATTGAGVITTFDMQYVPEALIYYGATTQLTGLKVEVLGIQDGTILDLDAAGLTALGRHRIMGVTAGAYIIPLATGIIKGKSCRITITNSATQTPSFYGYGDGNYGDSYIITKKQTVLANSNTMFDSFHAMFFPNFATTDYATLTFSDTTEDKQGQLSQIMTYYDLFYISQMIQTTAQVQVDNCQSNINSIQVMVGTTQTAYMVYTRLAS